MWIKDTQGNWKQVTKRSVKFSSPSVIKSKREAFERKKQTKAFKMWRYKQYKVEQRGVCYYCRKPIDGVWVTDHVVPLARGGTSNYLNLVVCCWACNEKKNVRFVKRQDD